MTLESAVVALLALGAIAGKMSVTATRVALAALPPTITATEIRVATVSATTVVVRGATVSTADRVRAVASDVANCAALVAFLRSTAGRGRATSRAALKRRARAVA